TRAWILRIAMNQCLNLLKRKQAQLKKVSQVQLLQEQITASVKSVKTIVLEKAVEEEWEDLLKQLPEKLMAVVTLRYIGEL
ncbi:RNA polymerase sigma factor, partial [Lysinibacillus sp. D3C2_S12]|uniref:RNA polymerase sigma factor n=1 Tax=Lysinibacillus sp. D3C2_S12 TaxID=2941226 RepID=UPI0037CC63FE